MSALSPGPLFLALLLGCTADSAPEDSSSPASTAFALSSTAFADGATIPLTHVCATQGGKNISPPLQWVGFPNDAASFALIMDDEVPPCGTGDGACRHWGVFNIPLENTALPEATGADGVVVGLNYQGNAEYAGPCPPNAHVYTLTLYALKSGMPPIEAGAGFSRSQFSSTYAAHLAGEASLTGTHDPGG